MKRNEKNPIRDNQTLDYPHQDIVPLSPDDNITRAFRFKWASDAIDVLLRDGFICSDYLDVGACDGYMALIVAKKKNQNGSIVRVDAIEAHDQSYEITEATAKLATGSGYSITTHHVLFEDYKANKLYDIITAFEILEHVKDPVAFLDKIYRLLKTGGCLMMTVPEESGRFGKTDSNPYHYWLFNIQSIVQMFDEKKWRIFQIFEIGDLIHFLVHKVD